MKYIDVNRLMSYTDPELMGLFSGRMTGKTVNMLQAIAAHAWREGKEFVYLDLTDEPANTMERRSKIFSGRNAVDWSATTNNPDFKLEVHYFNRNFFVIENYDDKKSFPENIRLNGQRIGYYQILANRIDYKSIEYPLVDYTIIDEFSDKIKKFGNFQYELAHHISTLYRERSWGQVILLGNAADAKNPLLNMLDINGAKLKSMVDKKPYYNGRIYLEFFTMKGLTNNFLQGRPLPTVEVEWPLNSRGEKMSFAERLAYTLSVDLDSVDIVDDSAFVGDNITNEFRTSVDVFVEGKGEYLSFTKLPRVLLVQSTKPNKWQRQLKMDTTLNKGFENQWLKDMLNYPTPKIFEDAQSKIKFKELGGM